MGDVADKDAAEATTPIDEWKCLRCGDIVNIERGRQPLICSNPNCMKHGPFKALTGPWIYFEGRRFISKLLADELMANHYFIAHEDSGEIHVYEGGVYRPRGETVIESEAQRKLGSLVKTHYVTEVVEFVRRETNAPQKQFEQPKHLLNLRNGILNLDTIELKDHTPDIVFLNQLPVEYDPNARCPKIEQFLSEILRPDDVEIAKEIVGYCLYADYPIQKAVALLGDGSNGKSTFLGLITAFLGKENCSSVALQDLEINRFASADLYGKLSNIYADLPTRALKTTGRFKMLTGGDLIRGEHKFRNPFTFKNHAKLLFSANMLPATADESSAFFRRWILIDFPNKFEGDRADPKILEKLTTREELSGLLNLAIRGLKRLLERGEFPHSKTTEKIREDYIRKSDPIGAFVMDCLEIDATSFEVKDMVYRAFVDYCAEHRLPAVDKGVFGKKLPSHIQVSDDRPLVEGRRRHAWKGIRFKEGHAPPAVEQVRLDDLTG